MPVHDNFALRIQVVDIGSLAILSESQTTCIRFQVGHYLRLFRMPMFHFITDS